MTLQARTRGGGDGSAGGMGHKKENAIARSCRRIWLGTVQGDECSAQHSLTCATNQPKLLDGTIALGWGRGHGPALQRNLLTLLWGKHEVEDGLMTSGCYR